MRVKRILSLCCIVLTACARAVSDPPASKTDSRLPTRCPTATPTATPFAVPAEAYYERGVERQRMGDAEDARQYFTWAIERDPAFAPAYVSRGAISLAEGDLEGALRDAGAALAIEPMGKAHVLRAEALQRMERHSEALRAYEEAVAQDPELREQTFQSRWLLARALEDVEELAALGAEYASVHPGSWRGHYYQAWPTIKSERYEEAIRLLVEGLTNSADQPALLWYLLGRAYLGIEAWQEAIVSLEAARELLEADDISLALHTEQPVADLFVTLGYAYLGAGRCADAEAMLTYGISVGAPEEEHSAALERARLCPTPTPVSYATPTPVE